MAKNEKTREISVLDVKAMKVRQTIITAITKNGPMAFYKDILDLLEDRDKLVRRVETLEWMLHAEGKTQGSFSDWPKD